MKKIFIGITLLISSFSYANQQQIYHFTRHQVSKLESCILQAFKLNKNEFHYCKEDIKNALAHNANSWHAGEDYKESARILKFLEDLND